MSAPAGEQPLEGINGREQAHSRAFEMLVDSPDDLAGLVAYALYKQSLRERFMEKLAAPAAADRVVTKTDRENLRGSADRRLQDFAARAVAEERPQIEREVIGDALSASEARLSAEVQRRTSWKTAVTTNLVAWIITLAVTVLFFYLKGLPDLAGNVADNLREGTQQVRPQTPQ